MEMKTRFGKGRYSKFLSLASSSLLAGSPASWWLVVVHLTDMVQRLLSSSRPHCPGKVQNLKLLPSDLKADQMGCSQMSASSFWCPSVLKLLFTLALCNFPGIEIPEMEEKLWNHWADIKSSINKNVLSCNSKCTQYSYANNNPEICLDLLAKFTSPLHFHPALSVPSLLLSWLAVLCTGEDPFSLLADAGECWHYPAEDSLACVTICGETLYCEYAMAFCKHL